MKRPDGKRILTIARTCRARRATTSTGSTSTPARSRPSRSNSRSRSPAPIASCSARTTPSTSETAKRSARCRHSIGSMTHRSARSSARTPTAYCPPHASPARPSPRSGMKKAIVESRTVRPPVAGFPVATRAGQLLFISGRAGLGESGLPLSGYAELGRKPPPALGLLAPDSWEETFVAQASRIYEDLETLLKEQGAAKNDLLFYSIYAREMRNFPVIARTRAALFAGGVAPPSTASQVPGLLLPGAVVYFDPMAVVPDPARGIAKQVLTSKHVIQGPLSNYELATRAGGYAFYAGVVGAHPETGVIVRGANELRDSAWPRPTGGLAERLLLEPLSAQTY